MREAEAPTAPSQGEANTTPNQAPRLSSDFLLSWLEIGKTKAEKKMSEPEPEVQTIEVEDQAETPQDKLAYIDIEENPFKITPEEKEQEVEHAVEQDIPVESLFERRQEVKDQRSYTPLQNDNPQNISEPTAVGDILATKSYLLPRSQPATIMPAKLTAFDMNSLMISRLYRRVIGFTFAITAVVIFLILIWTVG